MNLIVLYEILARAGYRMKSDLRGRILIVKEPAEERVVGVSPPINGAHSTNER